MSYISIPLTTAPDQKFSITLPVDDKNITLTMRVRYNTQANYWWISIYKGGTLLLDSLPLVAGNYPTANILEPYAYMGIGSAYIVKVEDTTLDYPDDSTLGSNFVLVWGDNIG